MSVIADINDEWVLSKNDTSLKTVKRVETDLDARVTKTWLEQCNVSSISYSKRFARLQAFFSEVGHTGNCFRYGVGNGLTHTHWTAIPFLCTQDEITITDHVTGTGEESQVWEAIGKWETVDGSYIEVPIPETGELYT